MLDEGMAQGGTKRRASFELAEERYTHDSNASTGRVKAAQNDLHYMEFVAPGSM